MSLNFYTNLHMCPWLLPTFKSVLDLYQHTHLSLTFTNLHICPWTLPTYTFVLDLYQPIHSTLTFTNLHICPWPLPTFTFDLDLYQPTHLSLTCCSLSSLRADKIRRQPSCASLCAKASPIPLEAPTIHTIFPRKLPVNKMHSETLIPLICQGL